MFYATQLCLRLAIEQYKNSFAMVQQNDQEAHVIEKVCSYACIVFQDTIWTASLKYNVYFTCARNQYSFGSYVTPWQASIYL